MVYIEKSVCIATNQKNQRCICGKIYSFYFRIPSICSQIFLMNHLYYLFGTNIMVSSKGWVFVVKCRIREQKKKEGANALSQVLENRGNFAGTLCLEFRHISHEIKSTEAVNVTLSVG